MKSKFAVILAALILCTPTAWCQRKANPLIVLAVRLATVEAEVKESSFFLVSDSIRTYGELPVPPEVQHAFDRVSRQVPGHFRLHYVNDRSLNAFAVPTGDIVVNRGLYEKTNGDEGAIAMAIGHELTHVVRKHGLHNMVRAAIADAALYAILQNSRSNPRGYVLAFGAILAKFSRDDENEADRFGFVYALQAGYDSAGCIQAIQAICNEGGRKRSFLNDHPDPEKRLKAVEAFAQAYRKGVPLEFIRYGKLDKDLESGIGAPPSLELLSDPSLRVLVNAPPTAFKMSIHPRFKVECEDGGFLSVLVRSPDGGVSCLFPNQYAPDGECQPGASIDIPSYTYRSKQQDLIRLKWDMKGDHQYLFVLSQSAIDWSSVVGKKLGEDEFKESLLNVAEGQGAHVLAYGNETLVVR